MNTTAADKTVFACVLAVLFLIAGVWVCALGVQRHAQHLMQTVYGQPTPELGAALAAGEADDADDMHLARGR